MAASTFLRLVDPLPPLPARLMPVKGGMLSSCNMIFRIYAGNEAGRACALLWNAGRTVAYYTHTKHHTQHPFVHARTKRLVWSTASELILWRERIKPSTLQ